MFEKKGKIKENTMHLKAGSVFQFATNKLPHTYNQDK